MAERNFNLTKRNISESERHRYLDRNISSESEEDSDLYEEEDYDDDYAHRGRNNRRKRPRSVNSSIASFHHTSRRVSRPTSATSSSVSQASSSLLQFHRTIPFLEHYNYEYRQATPSTSHLERPADYQFSRGPLDVERESPFHFSEEPRNRNAPPGLNPFPECLPSHSRNVQHVAASAPTARSSFFGSSLLNQLPRPHDDDDVRAISPLLMAFVSGLSSIPSDVINRRFNSFPTATETWSTDREGARSVVTINDSSDDEPEIVESEGIERLLENLRSLLQDEESSDVLFKVENREFRAHKIILKVRSSVFACMFKPHTRESSTGIVDIPDCSAEAFEILLSYLYTGTTDSVTSDNVCDVYYTADKYQISDLKSKCMRVMQKNISVDSFCEVVTLSLQHGESDLQKVATRFFCENVKVIIKTVQWQKFMKDYPEQANELYIKAINA